MQEQTPTPALERDISRLEKEIELYSQEKLCYEAQILRVRQTSLSLSMCVCVCVCVCVCSCRKTCPQMILIFYDSLKLN